MTGSLLTSKSTSNTPNPLSGLSSKGIKLSRRIKDFDDNSSERQLARSEDASSGDMHYESHAERGGHNETTISKVEAGNADASRTFGIQIKNETNVCYENV
jgi:hypothetical protein